MIERNVENTFGTINNSFDENITEFQKQSCFGSKYSPSTRML